MDKLVCSWSFCDYNDLSFHSSHCWWSFGINRLSKKKKYLRRKIFNPHFLHFSFYQVLAIQVKCFQEIMEVGFQAYRVKDIPWIKSLSWYLLIVSNYFFYGEYLFDYVGAPIKRIDSLKFLITSHRFISYCLYFSGFIFFVLSIVKRNLTRPFHLLAWVHVAILITVVQSYLIIRNIFEGKKVFFSCSH